MKRRYDVITFGSATLDVFVKTKEFLIKPETRFRSQKSVCFPFSSKADLQNLAFFTGGGGTNAAATFSLQGLKTAYCGVIGQDFAGQEVLKELKKFRIGTDFVFKNRQAATNFSIIFSWGRDRTCFVWRGASEFLTRKQIPFKELNPKWFYLAPLSGKLAPLTKCLVDFSQKKGIGTFVNLGHSQIELGLRKLKPLLERIDFVLLNQEEASLLTGLSYQKEKEIFEKLDNLVKGIVIMTKGKEGVAVSDGSHLWRAGIIPVKVSEKTGAGDSLGSGFLADYIKNQDIESALQFGIANAAACLGKIGAKEGLLKKGRVWKRVKVTKKKI